MNGFIGLDKTYRDNTVWRRSIGEIRVIRLPTMNPAVLEDIIRYILFNTSTWTVRMAITLTTTTTTTIFPYVLIKTVQMRYL